MRRSFGPPHLTLKPSKQKTTPQKKTKKTKAEKKEKKRKTKKIIKNELFNYQSTFSFLGGCPKFPSLTTWPKKRAPPKHYNNRGFSKLFFEENICVAERPFLDQKKQNPEIPVIIFLAYFLLFQQQKTQKLLKPLF